MDTALVVFTRDLRVHDNPALHQACQQARQVVPLFVTDPALAGSALGGSARSANRARFLAESLADLRDSLRQRGADLVMRHGDPAAEVIRLATAVNATMVYLADDVSHYAAARRRRLERACGQHRIGLTVTPGLTVVPPAALTPAGGDHYRIFTPYWRAWRATTWREHCPVPAAITMPAIEDVGRLPTYRGASPRLASGDGAPARLASGEGASSRLASGGETAGRQRFVSWRQRLLAGYADHHDDLAGDLTSRLSAYLRFGCVSPLELALGAMDRPGGEEFCRQLAWRDFFHQVTAAFPDIASKNYRPGVAWHEDQHALDAWRAGETGIPIVDAGMRQLAAEGFMHNRARMITASFLTRNLGIDWRHGYQHFGSLLADGDVACNAGNWQWVAGAGNNTRPNRVLNPLRQAQRFDKNGDYVRRYVPELAGLGPNHIHTPWQLAARQRPGYPAPLVELSLFLCWTAESGGGEVQLRDAAQTLGVHYQTAYAWVREGTLAARKTPRGYEVSDSDVRTLAERRAGGAEPRREIRVRDWTAQASGLYDAIVAGDEKRARHLFGRLAPGVPLHDVCDLVIAPALRRVGTEWAAGNLSVAVEHRASAICERLIASRALQPQGRPRGTAVTATPPGERHALPSLMAAACLREDRWRVHHLGADLPVEDLIDLTRNADADLVVLSCSSPDAIHRAGLVELEIQASLPQVRVLTGGRGATLRDLLDQAKPAAG
jgi:deoxyribodipyrimidine photo-lyase